MVRYTRIAIGLHWSMAIMIVLQLASGAWMIDALKDPATKAFAYDVFQWHKALGVCVLLLAFVRLGWRLTHRAPALPDALPRWEKRAARVGHAVLYVMMIAIPLSGWVMVSSSPYGLPTMIFGWFEWPHLPLAGNTQANDVSEIAHEWLAYGFALLLIGHIAAALRHHFVDRNDVLWQMLPIVKRRDV